MPNQQNEDVKTIQAELLKRFKQLQTILDDTTDFDIATAIVGEMREVNFRVTQAGAVLFAAQSQALEDLTADISKASNAAKKALQAFENVKDLLDAMSGLLTVVDQAIDLAKTLL